MSTDKHGEDEAPGDSATVTSRATTGGEDPDPGQESPQDRHSTTGTTSNDTFVGRASGDEAGDVEGSGGERRSGRPEDAHDGALRDV